jgi:Flp pilus assembly protein CpaB
MTYRLRNIVLAVALAVVAALLVTFYVASYKRSVQQSEKNVTVYVAVKKIPAGTSGAEAIEGAMLQPVKIARRNVVTGAISQPSQIEDLVATETTYTDEQVTVSRFRPLVETGVRSQLKGNVRALQIAGDSNQLLVGTLKKGDRVDVVGNFKVELDDDDAGGQRSGEVSFTRTVIRDLLVLKAPGGTQVEEELGSASGDGGFSVQLAVTDAQAQKLFFTMKNGDWHFDLRSPVNATDSAESLESIDTIVCDGMRRGKYWFCNGGGR